jgi:hypothetical protein
MLSLAFESINCSNIVFFSKCAYNKTEVLDQNRQTLRAFIARFLMSCLPWIVEDDAQTIRDGLNQSLPTILNFSTFPSDPKDVLSIRDDFFYSGNLWERHFEYQTHTSIVQKNKLMNDAHGSSNSFSCTMKDMSYVTNECIDILFILIPYLYRMNLFEIDDDKRIDKSVIPNIITCIFSKLISFLLVSIRYFRLAASTSTTKIISTEFADKVDDMCSMACSIIIDILERHMNSNSSKQENIYDEVSRNRLFYSDSLKDIELCDPSLSCRKLVEKVIQAFLTQVSS